VALSIWDDWGPVRLIVLDGNSFVYHGAETEEIRL